jgi:heme/copper-type cytochrome/quinol oxidase subunit 2
VLPILISLFVAMIPLFYQAYNPNGFAICSIAELECTDSYTTCERHREEVWDLSYFRFTCICLGNLMIVVSVIILVQHVRFREERMNRNSGDNTNNLSIKVYWQGIWYVAAFMFSWVPWYLWQVSLSKISQTLPIILWKLLSLTGSV